MISRAIAIDEPHYLRILCLIHYFGRRYSTSRILYYCLGRLDHEQATHYDLVVEAFDFATATPPAGLPGPFITTLHLLINLTDINDNAPQFADPNDSFQLEETEELGTIVYNVTAWDVDSGLNGELSFAISQLVPASNITYFVINEGNGSIRLDSSLDLDFVPPIQEIVLLITVTDKGTPVQMNETNLTILILQVDEFSPSFLHGDISVEISENQPISLVLFNVNATDPDFGLGGEFVFVKSGSPDDSFFTLDEDSGVVVGSILFDRETEDSYSWMIVVETIAINPVYRSSTVNVLVTILDENDNPPMFQQAVYMFKFRETTNATTGIYQVNATDRDINLNANLRYSLYHVNSANNEFSIDELTGLITLRKDLNLESPAVLLPPEQIFNLTITAFDRSAEPKYTNATVLLQVTGVNEFSPNFSNMTGPMLPFKENISISETLFQVVATDGDFGPQGVISYSFLSGNDEGRFSIDSATGSVVLVSGLDREDKDMYDLVIIALDSDPVLSDRLDDTLSIRISVEDVNDNAPILSVTSCAVSVAENSPINSSLFSISASDADLTNSSNSDIEFFSTSTVPFSIDSVTGVVSLSGAIDYEGVTSYQLRLFARDKGSPSLTSSVLSCPIQILGINEFPPVFTSNSYSFSVAEKSPVNTVFGRVSATDNDRGIDGEVVYSVSGDNRFIVNANGDLLVLGFLDREIDTVPILLNVSAVDSLGGSLRFTAHSFVTVTVEDINDNSPTFIHNNQYQSISEDTGIGVSIAQFVASDRDFGSNGEVMYSISAGPFSINSSTGVVSVESALDRETRSSYELTITASDQASQNQTNSTATLSVNIGDVNDNPPIFSQPNYSSIISQPTSINMVILNVSASDLDIGTNAQVFYSITSQPNNFFAIESSNGTVTLKQILPCFKSQQTLVVSATDKGIQPMSAQVAVLLNISGAMPCPNRSIHNITCGCNCIGNWSGVLCDTCELGLCQNDGSHNSTCTGCNCVGNWSGNNCSVCSLSNQCQNSALPDQNCSHCECPQGLTGTFCDQEFDDCSLLPCGTGEFCTNLPYPQTYSCTMCGPNYVLTSGTCVLVDECDSNPCHPKNSLACTDLIQDYTCTCVPDTTGKNCSLIIDDCVNSSCMNNGSCVDGNGSYSCECVGGFTGMNCELCNISCGGGTVNGSCQCESPCDINPCENGGMCQANISGYDCICAPGFEGVNCIMVSLCIPACNPITQMCEQINSGYECTCKDGFLLELNGECITLDECQTFPCDPYANCTDTFGSYTCECKDGFEGDGYNCSAINECSVHYPLCGEYPARCVDQLLKYECVCPSGYTVELNNSHSILPYCFEPSCQPKVCVDIDECADIDICDLNQDCVNTQGSYFCECLEQCAPVLVGTFVCETTTDDMNITFFDTVPGVTVQIQCPNTQYGLISRTCLPSCECIADRPQWGYSRVTECVSPELDMALNQLRRLSITKSTSQSELESIIQDVWLLAQNSRLQGIDLEVAAIFIQEVEQVIEDWPTPTLSLGISSFDKLLDVADSLLSNSEESWEETDNSTFNLLSIVDTIHKIANRVSIYLYDQGMEYYAFSGTSFSFKLLTWDNYTAEYGVRNLQFPELTNHSISLPFVDSSQVSLPGGRTPQQCRTSLLLLRITSLALLLNAALTGSVRRNQCINLRVQTPSRKYEFQGDYISVAATRGVCQFASINEFSPSNLFVISLPNSPTYHEDGKTFVNTRLESIELFQQFQQIYAPTCTIISSRNDPVVQFECDSSDGYIPLLISPTQPPIPNTTLTLTLLIKCFLAFSALCCFTALILLTLRIFQFRKGLTFVRINVILTLMIAFVVFLVGIDRTELNWLCTVSGILMQYLAFSTTLWSLLDMINVILVVTKTKKVFYDFIFAGVGYLLPAIPIPLSYKIISCSYQRVRLYCWPSSETNINLDLAITIPNYIIIFFAMIFLGIMVLLSIFRKRTELGETTSNRCIQFLRLQISSSTLPFLLTATWAVATYGFSRDDELPVYQITFIALSTLTGVYCLLVYYIASSEKFRFQKSRSGKVRVEHETEPNTMETRIPRASLINPVYTEGDEWVRASTAYSSHALPQSEDDDTDILIYKNRY